MMPIGSRRCVFGAIALGILSGCGRQPPLSEKAYEAAMATYSVCNRRHAEGLQAVTATIKDLATSKAISDGEAEQLHEDRWTAEHRRGHGVI